MTRPQNETNALIAVANELIDAHNHMRVDVARELVVTLWEQFFSDGRVYPKDAEILDAILCNCTKYCSDQLKYDYNSEYARIKNQPVLYQAHESQLNEDSRFLLTFKHNITSQDGEDGIISKIFEIIGTENKWCVEFGAYDGLVNCNSHTLVTGGRWNGILIEADSGRFSGLKKTYEGFENAHVFRTFVGHGPGCTPLEDILSDLNVPVDFDLISIDIDGNDWHLWREFTGYRPRVVIIEFNPTIANDVVFIQKNDQKVMQGNSLRAFVMLGKEKGYELVCVTTYNAIFVVREEFDKFGIADNSIDALHEPLMDGRFFHCYDSSIYNTGMPKLVWRVMDEEHDARFIGIEDMKLVRKQ